MSRAPALLTTAIVVDALLAALTPALVFLDVTTMLPAGLAIATAFALAAGAVRLRAQAGVARREASVAVVALSVAAIAQPLNLAAQFVLAQRLSAAPEIWFTAAQIVEGLEAIGLVALASAGMRGPAAGRTGSLAIALALVTHVAVVRAADIPTSATGLVLVIANALLSGALAIALLGLVGRVAGDAAAHRDAAISGLERASRGLLWGAVLRISTPFVLGTIIAAVSISRGVSITLGLILQAIPLLVVATGIARASAWSAPGAPRRRLALAGVLLAATPAGWLMFAFRPWFPLHIVPLALGPGLTIATGLVAIVVLGSALAATARALDAPAVARRATALTVVVIACNGLSSYLIEAPRDSFMAKVVGVGIAMTVIHGLALLILRRVVRDVSAAFEHEPVVDVPTAIARDAS